MSYIKNSILNLPQIIHQRNSELKFYCESDNPHPKINIYFFFQYSFKNVAFSKSEMLLIHFKKFKIPYDELIFGKPYAHYYIDDLAVNALDNLNFKLGQYENHILFY